ncbi:MAG: hypothetical protein ACYCY0_13275 [Acidithiobacillus ferrivorans]
MSTNAVIAEKPATEPSPEQQGWTELSFNDVQQPGYYAPPVNNPQCPSGYVCTPNQPAPPPPCPAGYTCTPDR